MIVGGTGTMDYKECGYEIQEWIDEDVENIPTTSFVERCGPVAVPLNLTGILRELESMSQTEC